MISKKVWWILIVWLVVFTSTGILQAEDNENSQLLNPTVWEQEFDVISMLIQLEADPNVKDDKGLTPLMFAAKSNIDPRVFQLLVEAGANIEAKDINGMTPLMHAAKSNENPQVIYKLIELGADVNAKDIINFSPLEYAYKFNNNKDVIISILRQAGAEKSDYVDAETVTLNFLGLIEQGKIDEALRLYHKNILKQIIFNNGDLAELYGDIKYLIDDFSDYSYEIEETRINFNSDEAVIKIDGYGWYYVTLWKEGKRWRIVSIDDSDDYIPYP